MKMFSMILLLAAGVVISGCWDNEKEKRAADFMSTLSKCDGCREPKSFFPLADKEKQE